MFLEKRLKFRKTLSFRLTIWYAAIFTLSSFLAFSVFYYRIYSITMATLDEELIEEVEELSIVLSEDGIAQVKAEIAEEAEEEDEEDMFFRVISPKGKVLASTNMSSWGNIDVSHDRLKNQEGQTDYVIQTLPVPGREHKARVISAAIGSNEIAQIGMTLEDEEEYLMIFRNLFYFLFLILAFFSGLVGWFIARKGLRDVEEVTQTAMEISTGSPEKRVKVKSKYEEIEKLVDAFNRMLDRIQKIHKAIREINDNIAHDLRSPLARIRGVAEMTLIREKSVDDFKKMGASIIEECDTLIDMINTMLEITEAEAGVNGQEIEEFDLAKLISDACEIFRPIAKEKHIVINLSAPDSLNFRGDIKKLQRIVTNLLENAIKYTPDEGTVRISLLEHDGKIDIVVEDTGIGISEDDLPRIFERFYRSERSRTTGGIGLGLSLAKAFAVSLGGAINAKSTLGKGSTFAVSFPN
jgi:signal transduction histidine kinase